MAIKENRQIYSIPENFIDESRIIKGMFRTRNFIEGVLMAAVVALVSFAIPAADTNTRIFIVISCAGPFFLIGNAGFNGDPISTTLINAKKWLQDRGVMLYNYKVRALIKSPLQAMYDREEMRDRVVDFVDNMKEKQRERNAQTQYIEGETFVFAEDKDLEGIYADEYCYVYEDEDGNIIDVVDVQKKLKPVMPKEIINNDEVNEELSIEEGGELNGEEE